jgi:hypothetical protein
MEYVLKIVVSLSLGINYRKLVRNAQRSVKVVQMKLLVLNALMVTHFMKVNVQLNVLKELLVSKMFVFLVMTSIV